MTKDGALIHAMKMGVRRRDRLADAMNMAWTCARRSRDGLARLIPAGTKTFPRRCFMKISVLAVLLLAAAAQPAAAQSGPTPQEQMTCRSAKFCAEHIGKPPQMNACLREN